VRILPAPSPSLRFSWVVDTARPRPAVGAVGDHSCSTNPNPSFQSVLLVNVILRVPSIHCCLLCWDRARHVLFFSLSNPNSNFTVYQPFRCILLRCSCCSLSSARRIEFPQTPNSRLPAVLLLCLTSEASCGNDFIALPFFSSPFPSRRAPITSFFFSRAFFLEQPILRPSVVDDPFVPSSGEKFRCEPALSTLSSVMGSFSPASFNPSDPSHRRPDFLQLSPTTVIDGSCPAHSRGQSSLFLLS